MGSVIETLRQLQTMTFDGDLISKSARDWLFERGLVQRAHGYNWLNEEGCEYLYTLKMLENI